MIINYQQDVFDFTLSQYGEIDSLFYFLNQNTDINITDTLLYNQEVNIGTYIPVTNNTSIVENYTPPTLNVEILEQQSIWDLAIQYGGDVSYAYTYLINNPNLGGFDNLNLKGEILTYTQINNTITNYFKNKNLILATNLSPINILLTNRSFNTDFNFDFN